MTTTFNHDLVLLGRQLRKMSQADLAKAISVTQSYLSKIEHGLSDPSETVIKQLADTLGLPQSFFYQTDRVYGLPVSINHRKKTSVGQHDLDSVHAEINIRFMHLKRLLQSVKQKAQFEMPRLDIDEYNGDPERIAKLVRSTWYLPKGPLKNLTECAEQAGCVVIWCDFKSNPIDGISYSLPGFPPCIFINKNQPSDRMRFTLGHEIGHIVMHSVPTPNMEDEANRFASALLMPPEDIRIYFAEDVTLSRLASLKPIWRVSMASLLVAAQSTGAISKYQATFLWKQMSSLRIRLQEPPELDFPYEEPKILPMIFKTYIDQFGYSVDDLCKVLNINNLELIDMYPFLDNKKSHLRLVN